MKSPTDLNLGGVVYHQSSIVTQILDLISDDTKSSEGLVIFNFGKRGHHRQTGNKPLFGATARKISSIVREKWRI